MSSSSSHRHPQPRTQRQLDFLASDEAKDLQFLLRHLKYLLHVLGTTRLIMDTWENRETRRIFKDGFIDHTRLIPAWDEQIGPRRYDPGMDADFWNSFEVDSDSPTRNEWNANMKKNITKESTELLHRAWNAMPKGKTTRTDAVLKCCFYIHRQVWALVIALSDKESDDNLAFWKRIQSNCDQLYQWIANGTIMTNMEYVVGEVYPDRYCVTCLKDLSWPKETLTLTKECKRCREKHGEEISKEALAEVIHAIISGGEDREKMLEARAAAYEAAQTPEERLELLENDFNTFFPPPPDSPPPRAGGAEGGATTSKVVKLGVINQADFVAFTEAMSTRGGLEARKAFKEAKTADERAEILFRMIEVSKSVM
jgi:hypothetical protein